MQNFPTLDCCNLGCVVMAASGQVASVGGKFYSSNLILVSNGVQGLPTLDCCDLGCVVSTVGGQVAPVG